MRTSIPEAVTQIIDDMDAHGNLPLTRLTVLKKWFDHPGRLSRFGLWVARRAAGRKGKTKGEFGALLDEARALLGPGSTRESYETKPPALSATETLHLARRCE
jgi:hypothetical protein